jgi:hypothetical protein|tara:strand:+ start:2320 stop:2493 length:174 start_codon:yes stop_codon:yes gene_type:complete
MSKPKKIRTITINKEQVREIIRGAYAYGFAEGRRAEHEEIHDIAALIEDAQDEYGKL